MSLAIWLEATSAARRVPPLFQHWFSLTLYDLGYFPRFSRPGKWSYWISWLSMTSTNFRTCTTPLTHNTFWRLKTEAHTCGAPLPPLGHIWDVTLVCWKSNINSYPHLWNSPPAILRTPFPTFNDFKQKLKTHLLVWMRNMKRWQ